MNKNYIVISNINEYKQEHINDKLILTRLHPYIDEISLFKNDLTYSKVLNCYINNELIHLHKYKQIILHMYNSINIQSIIQNTILNISNKERYDKGFKYYENLGISIQGSDARRLLKEIININKIKKDSITLKIQLRNNKIYTFEI